jgi:hypothetical protein
MQIVQHRPADRGVTTLMYVGDDAAVEQAVQAPSAKEMGVGALAVLIAWQSKGITRLAAMGVASFIGYRVYRAQK